MAAVGCTSCRECNTGTCHVGITAHIPTAEAAHEMGVKKYTPRDYEKSVEGLVNFFTAVTNEIGVLTMRLGFTRIPLYSVVFHCRALGGVLEAHPLECADAGWFAADALPEPLAGYQLWGDFAFAAVRGEPVDTFFDPPRDPPWRG